MRADPIQTHLQNLNASLGEVNRADGGTSEDPPGDTPYWYSKHAAAVRRIGPRIESARGSAPPKPIPPVYTRGYGRRRRSPRQPPPNAARAAQREAGGRIARSRRSGLRDGAGRGRSGTTASARGAGSRAARAGRRGTAGASSGETGQIGQSGETESAESQSRQTQSAETEKSRLPKRAEAGPGRVRRGTGESAAPASAATSPAATTSSAPAGRGLRVEGRRRRPGDGRQGRRLGHPHGRRVGQGSRPPLAEAVTVPATGLSRVLRTGDTRRVNEVS